MLNRPMGVKFDAQTADLDQNFANSHIPQGSGNRSSSVTFSVWSAMKHSSISLGQRCTCWRCNATYDLVDDSHKQESTQYWSNCSARPTMKHVTSSVKHSTAGRLRTGQGSKTSETKLFQTGFGASNYLVLGAYFCMAYTMTGANPNHASQSAP